VQIPENIQNKFDEILDNFDFEKVHRVMKLLNWEWMVSVGGVPEIQDLKAEVRARLKEVYTNAKTLKRETYLTYCGGLKVQYSSGKDEAGDWESFEVDFVLENWRTEG
jgi:hypothetical protein